MSWLHAEAVKRGYGTKRTVFLADGDRKIWKLQQKYFPKATACLDWFHVSEKLWSIGECLYAEGTDELADWGVGATRRPESGPHSPVGETSSTTGDDVAPLWPRYPGKAEANEAGHRLPEEEPGPDALR